MLCRARAIEIRQQNQEAVGGFFSQIGSLYTVHHLWGEQGFQVFMKCDGGDIFLEIIVLELIKQILY